MGYAINYVSGGDCQNWTLNAIGNYAFIETTVDNKLYRTHICRETVERVDKEFPVSQGEVDASNKYKDQYFIYRIYN